MALNDVIKKKQATSGEKKKVTKFNLFEDIRVLIAFTSLACVGLIVLTAYNIKANNKIIADIDVAVSEYNDNQKEIADLLALQSKSSEYKAQRDQYNEMISTKALDQTQIMIDMEGAVESYDCALTEIAFGEASTLNGVNQLQVTLNISGTYNNIMKFAYDIVNGEQIKRIDTIKLMPLAEKDKDKDKADLKKATIVIVLFSK